MAKLHLAPSEYHKHLMAHTRRSMAFDGGDFAKWRGKLRRKLRAMVGLDSPFGPDRLPLKARTLWKSRHEYGTIEKITFQSEPHSDVIAYWCVPHEVAPPYQTWICLQGHSTGAHVSIARQRDDEDAPLATEGDRDFGIGCMKRGLAALCIDQRSFGLRRELKQKMRFEHGCIDATMHSLMLGRTLIGERVFDVDRGIDYLASRGDVDMSTLGVMGNSGGGTISVYSAALLDRIRIAMPSCFFCTFADSLMAIRHCPDNFIPGLLQYAENADVLGLFAPKPVIVVAGKTDDIFPIRAVRKAFADLKKIYAAAGAADRCHLVVGPEGHRFYAEAGWRVALPEQRRLAESRR